MPAITHKQLAKMRSLKWVPGKIDGLLWVLDKTQVPHLRDNILQDIHREALAYKEVYARNLQDKIAPPTPNERNFYKFVLEQLPEVN